MKLSAKSGATLATAAAALMLSGTVATFTAPSSAVAADQVKCFGVNACKGQGACKTAKNDCKGQNACKGQGFVQMTKAECDDQGGSTEAPKS